MSASQNTQTELGGKIVSVGRYLLSQESGLPKDDYPMGAVISCLMRYAESHQFDFDDIVDFARKNGAASMTEISERSQKARTK